MESYNVLVTLNLFYVRSKVYTYLKPTRRFHEQHSCQNHFKIRLGETSAINPSNQFIKLIKFRLKISEGSKNGNYEKKKKKRKIWKPHNGKEKQKAHVIVNEWQDEARSTSTAWRWKWEKVGLQGGIRFQAPTACSSHVPMSSLNLRRVESYSSAINLIFKRQNDEGAFRLYSLVLLVSERVLSSPQWNISRIGTRIYIITENNLIIN